MLGTSDGEVASGMIETERVQGVRTLIDLTYTQIYALSG